MLKEKTLGLFVKTNGRLSQPLFGGLGFIICLHRVLPKPLHSRWSGENSMAVSPEYLEWLINFVRQQGFELISIDEVLERINGKPSPKKFAAITLDDGWKDNLVYGTPVFEKHNVPYTIYVANCFANGTAKMWAENLEEIVYTRAEVAFKYGETAITKQFANDADRREAFHKLRYFILEANSLAEFNARIEAVEHSASFVDSNKDFALSWEEIKGLAQTELCTIGAHTMNHLPLAKLSEETALTEMSLSKQEIESKTGKAVAHFAYPYGSKNECSLREFDLAAKAGYSLAVTGRAGNVFTANEEQLMAVPRYAIGEGTREERLRYIMNGILHFSFNGFKRVVAD